jgi:predicted nucleic acid-binding protein
VILLDTNVLSELTRAQPAAQVVEKMQVAARDMDDFAPTGVALTNAWIHV